MQFTAFIKRLYLAGLLCVPVIYSCRQMIDRETFYENKAPKEKWSVVIDEGVEFKNGPYYSWYKNGKTKDVFSYLDDQKHGVQKSFYKFGGLRISANFLFGKLSGRYMKWDENGKLIFRTMYLEGKKNGLHTSYWNNGKIYKQVNYKDDREYGLALVFFKEGSLEQALWFDMGKQIMAPDDSSEIVSSVISNIAQSHSDNKSLLPGSGDAEITIEE